MPCYKPLSAWRNNFSDLRDKTKKRAIFFSTPSPVSILNHTVESLTLPCGQCIGCRLDRSRQWAIRCVHEASMYEQNAFITLTYSDECLPPSGSLVKRDFTLFLKKLRKKFGSGIRFFMCGEYGEKLGRPHYHACLFNFDFSDKILFKGGDFPIYTSEVLNGLWGLGHCSIGDVTFDSAAYVARYITKKINGADAPDHYGGILERSEQCRSCRDNPTASTCPNCRSNNSATTQFTKLPEYTNQSRRPGIGKPWLLRFNSDVYPLDFVVLRGKKMRPPKYYDKLEEQSAPDVLSSIKIDRSSRMHSKSFKLNNTPERLKVRETVQVLKLKQLKRKFENDESI